MDSSVERQRIEPISLAFVPPDERTGSAFERHTPPRPLFPSDIHDPNAQEYYFPPEMIRIPEVRHAARFGVFTWEPAREAGYLYNTGGTCFLLEGGFLVTQAHCLENLGPIEERNMIFDSGMGNGSEKISLQGARVLFMPDTISPGKNDIAIIDVSNVQEFLRFQELSMADVTVGEPIFSVGYPYETGGKSQRISLGTLEQVLPDNTFKYNCLSTQGQSGGPLINVRGEVIGMTWKPEAEGHIQGNPQTRMVGISAQGIQRFLAEANKVKQLSQK